jgi:hypothetical protein
MDQDFIRWAASFLLAEYNRAWRYFGSSTKVACALELEPGEHFELAAWRLSGAHKVVTLRSMKQP